MHRSANRKVSAFHGGSKPVKSASRQHATVTASAFPGTNPPTRRHYFWFARDPIGISAMVPKFVQGSSEEELRVVCEGLFVPQRDDGIHTRRSPRRNCRSGECGEPEYQRST